MLDVEKLRQFLRAKYSYSAINRGRKYLLIVDLIRFNSQTYCKYKLMQFFVVMVMVVVVVAQLGNQDK